MIKAVFFDIDDTLYSFQAVSQPAMEQVYQYVKENLGVEKEVIAPAIADAMDHFHKTLGDIAALHNRQIRFQRALESLHLPVFPHATKMYQIYWNSVLDTIQPEPGLIPLLEALKKKGIYIGIGSDMTSYIQYQKLEKMGVDQYLDSAVTSEEAGADKPDPRMFQICMEKAAVTPEESLFIGDNPEKDIAGALALGMHVLCYTKYAKKMPPAGVPCIESYETCIKEDGIYLGDIQL